MAPKVCWLHVDILAIVCAWSLVKLVVLFLYSGDDFTCSLVFFEGTSPFHALTKLAMTVGSVALRYRRLLRVTWHEYNVSSISVGKFFEFTKFNPDQNQFEGSGAPVRVH